MADEAFARVKALWDKCHRARKGFYVDLPANVVIYGSWEKEGEKGLLYIACNLSEKNLHWEEWFVIDPDGTVLARRWSHLGKATPLRDDSHLTWFGKEVLIEDEED